MTNYLKNFLDKERQTFIKNKDTMTPAEYMEWNSKYEARLVNFVLDLSSIYGKITSTIYKR